jgi:ribosomal-protein-alanine N-acetyltransferase
MTHTTERTISAPLVRDDFDSLIEMYLEPDSNKYVKPLRDKSTEFYLDFLNKRLLQNETSIGFWVVKCKITKEIMGTINLNLFESIDGHHIGCHLKRENWNKGLATELLSKLITYGVKEKSLDKIYGLVEKENYVSKQLLKKIGLHYHSNKEILDTDLEIYCTNTVHNR